MIEYPKTNSRIFLTVFIQYGQQKAPKSYLTRSDRNKSLVKRALKAYFLLACLYLLNSGRDMRIKPPALGSERYSFSETNKKCTVQFTFKIFYCSCDVGLIIHQCFRSTGYISVFCGIIKYFIIFKAYIHTVPPRSRS